MHIQPLRNSWSRRSPRGLCEPSGVTRWLGRDSICLLAALLVLLLGPLTRLSVAQPARALEVDLTRERLVGLPIHWSNVEGVLLESSGRFQLFDMQQVQRHRVLENDFQPQSLVEARRQLMAEFGPNFETIIAGPYVIAAPRGQAERWQTRFTALLAGYVRYFETRGWKLRKPDFPLCVIVFPDRVAFERYAATETNSLPPEAVGSYFPRSNRCVLYQLSSALGTDWQQTEATIVHEAVHQLAYNTGVHERLFENPLWFVEGLATMFEQATVYDLTASQRSIVDRMHPQMVKQLQPMFHNPAELEANIQNLLLSDELFRTDPYNAYALGWAMTFTMVERMPREYGTFLKIQAARGFGEYTAGSRRADYQTAFKIPPEMLAQYMQRLLQN
jgi:hypothetical protein